MPTPSLVFLTKAMSSGSAWSKLASLPAHLLDAADASGIVDDAVVGEVGGPFDQRSPRALGQRSDGGVIEVRPSLGHGAFAAQLGPVHVQGL